MAKDTGTAEAKAPQQDDDVNFVGAAGVPNGPEKKKDLTGDQPAFQANPANAEEEEEKARKARKDVEDALKFEQKDKPKTEQEAGGPKANDGSDGAQKPLANQVVPKNVSQKDMEALNDAWGVPGITKAFDEALQGARINFDRDANLLTFKLANNKTITWYNDYNGVNGFIGFPHKHKMDDLDAKVVVAALASQGRQEMRVFGDRESKEKMWLEAMRQGLTVTNFQPLASNDPNSVYQKWMREMQENIAGAAPEPNAPTPETPAEKPAAETTAEAEAPATPAAKTPAAEAPATPATETAEAEKPAQPKTTDVEGLSVKITGLNVGNGPNQYSSITGTVVGGDDAHVGKEVFVLVSNEAAQEIMNRPDVAPHIQPTVYEPEPELQEDGTTKVKLRAEAGEAPDSSKTLQQAIEGLPPVKFDQITVNNEVSNDKLLEGFSGIKGNTASFAFEDAPKDEAPKEEAKADAKAAAPATEAEKPATPEDNGALKSSFLAEKPATEKPAAEEVKAEAPAKDAPVAEEKAPEKPATTKSAFIGDTSEKKDAPAPKAPEVPKNESFEETLARRIEQAKNPKVEAALRTLKAELDSGNLKLDGMDRELVHAKLSGSKPLSVKNVNAAISYAAGKPENKGIVLPTVDDDKPSAPQQKRKNPGLG